MSKRSCEKAVNKAMREHNWSRDRAEKYVYGGIYNAQHKHKSHSHHRKK